MRKRCIEGYAAAAAFLVVARATATIMVDDGDPGIQYHGTWVHNLINDPTDLNYGGSVTFTNVSGSTATGTTAGTAIAVFGAFEVAGTFSMHSTYSIDGGPATDFIPASTTVRAAYRQKFFQSDTLSDGEHTLVIANVGRELWLDYLLITPPPQATTTAAASTLSQKVQAPSASTTQAPPPTTGPATTSAGQSVTTQSGSGPSSQTQTTHSLSNTNNATLTSTDAAVPLPPAPSSPSQSQTSVLASGIASPTSTPARAHSSKLAVGAIVGLAVAGLVIVVIVLVGLVGWRSRRRKQARRRDDLHLGRRPGSDGAGFRASGEAGTGPCARQQQQQQGLDGHLAAVAVPARARLHAGASGDMRVGELWSGFEPLGSPSSASPLLARHPHGGRQQQQQKESPITSSAGLSRYMSPLDLDERRRSVDGGVRIAGGPPGNLRQEDALGDGDDDVRSGLSTLPPSYQLYTAV